MKFSVYPYYGAKRSEDSVTIEADDLDMAEQQIEEMKNEGRFVIDDTTLNSRTVLYAEKITGYKIEAYLEPEESQLEALLEVGNAGATGRQSMYRTEAADRGH